MKVLHCNIANNTDASTVHDQLSLHYKERECKKLKQIKRTVNSPNE